MKIGIIGAGAVGRKHAEAANLLDVTVSRVADTNLARAEEVAGLCGATACNSVDAVLADRELQAVVIAVPNRWHEALATAAMTAGLDVLLEKPMALSASQCAAINEVARQTGRLVQIGFVHRYTAVGRAAREVAQARLGRIYHAKAQLNLRRGVPGLGQWFTTKASSGGGSLIDVGVHLVDLSMHILGFPEVADVCGQVYANFGRRMRGYVYENMWAGPPNWDGVCDVEDSAHAFIRFKSGVTLELDVSWAGNFPQGSMPLSLMGFFGDEGGMTFELFGDALHLAYEQDGGLVDERLPAPDADPFRDQLADFLRSVETREVYGATGGEGQIVQSIVDGVYHSSMPLEENALTAAAPIA